MAKTKSALQAVRPTAGADVLPMVMARNMAFFALGQARYREALMVALGAGLGLRASDLRRVTWADIVDPTGEPKVQVIVSEMKTGKKRVVWLMPWVRRVIADAYRALAPVPFYEPVVPWTRQTIWERVKRLADEIGYRGKITPHSLRKAFCDFIYNLTRDPVLASRLTGHSDPRHLLRYIGRVPESEERIWEYVARAEI